MQLTAITSAKVGASGKAAALAAFKSGLGAFTLEFLRQMQDYPDAQPWRVPTPKSGPRAGGRRTGDYGRGWRVSGRTTYSVTIINNVPYAVWVGGPTEGDGPKQTANMAGRGWPSMTEAKKSSLDKLKSELKVL